METYFSHRYNVVLVLQESTAGGGQNTDELFLETERFALNTGTSGPAAAGGGQAGGMSFNFFGGPAEAVPAPSLSSLFGGAAAPAQDAGEGLFASEDKLVAQGESNAVSVVASYPMLSEISFVNIVEGAFKFCREKSAEEIHSNWLESRDKMGLAYKKKRREARKKKANVASAARSSTDDVSRKRKPDYASAYKKKGSTKRSKKA
jgi:hypothetical protein